MVLRATRWLRFRSAPCRRVLPHVGFSRRHSQDERPNLSLYARPTDASASARPLVGHQLAMPAQNRVQRHTSVTFCSV